MPYCRLAVPRGFVASSDASCCTETITASQGRRVNGYLSRLAQAAVDRELNAYESALPEPGCS